jgi:hypothetical protein
MPVVETFIVRVWDAEGSTEPTAHGVVRGVVRRVRNGRETTFASWEELCRVLAEPSGRGLSPSAPARDGGGGV